MARHRLHSSFQGQETERKLWIQFWVKRMENRKNSMKLEQKDDFYGKEFQHLSDIDKALGLSDLDDAINSNITY